MTQQDDLISRAAANKQKAEESLLKSDPDSVNKDDVIYRQAAVDALRDYLVQDVQFGDELTEGYNDGIDMAITTISKIPSAQPERKYTLEEVAEILASAIGDECACNINGIDEWLPESCKYTEIGEECPNQKEKHGCWMQFLLQGGTQI